MRKIVGLIGLAVLLGKVPAAAGEGLGTEALEERWGLGAELKGEEVWRRELGKERCLLLYIDERNELQICFADGPWVYLTEELVDRVKEAGLEFWERKTGL